MNSKFQPLFEPCRLNNGVEIKNRFVVAPMTHWASNDDGTLNPAERAFLQDLHARFRLIYLRCNFSWQ